jgi:hypothetical protein
MGGQRGGELADIAALLQILRHEPLAGEPSWSCPHPPIAHCRATACGMGCGRTGRGVWHPDADALAWRRLVADALDPEARPEQHPGSAAAWDLLSTVLRPLMWRNNKEVVAQVGDCVPHSAAAGSGPGAAQVTHGCWSAVGAGAGVPPARPHPQARLAHLPSGRKGLLRAGPFYELIPLQRTV